jgi:hypothetical protein
MKLVNETSDFRGRKHVECCPLRCDEVAAL